MRSCSTCTFMSIEVGDDAEPRMDCRRFPPIVTDDDGEGLVNVWPQVRDEDWCGEWTSTS